MKIMVLGNARHGKDTVCNLLTSIYRLKFIGSSYFVAQKAVKPWLENLGIVYTDLDTMYADRVNHRAAWFNAIADYNKNDPARLGRELFEQYDIYCGIRNPVEFDALKKERAFDVCFWVDRGLLVEPEPESSNKMMPDMADFIINNNGTLDLLRGEVIETYRMAFKKLHIK